MTDYGTPFNYYGPTRLVFGRGVTAGAGALVAGLGVRSVLLVCGSGATRRSAGFAALAAKFEAAGVRATVFDKVTPDPHAALVAEAADAARSGSLEAVVAYGGGSPIDCAKSAALAAANGGPILDYVRGKATPSRPALPIVAVTTTAGTGSEMSSAAVTTDLASGQKLGYTNESFFPRIAIVDPENHTSMPTGVTAATGMDALTHAVEAYYCLAKNPLSDGAALAAVRLVGEHLLRVTRDPSDRNGRLAMATAALLAGAAFSNSMVGMVHTMGHATGSVCGVAHGVCMAIYLPYGLEYNLHKRGETMAELLLPLAGEEVYRGTPPVERARRMIAEVRKLNADLHEATGGRHARFLSEVRDREGRPMVTREQIPEIARAALNDGSIFYNPEEMDFDDLRMVIFAAWTGEPLDASRIRKG